MCLVCAGSSTSANLAIQLARLAGVKTIAVLDTAKHGLRLFNHKTIRPDLLVDSHDPERAIDIIRQNTNGQVRFGIDTRGKKTASHLLQILSSTRKDFLVDRDDHLQNPISPPDTPEEYPLRRGHLIGMSGLPKKTPSQNVLLHSVPIKLFHEVPSVGVALCRWLERLLEQEYIHPPDIVGIENGLDSINLGLDRMRKGHISGGKLVVQVS